MTSPEDMELSTDPEKQQLIEAHLEPLDWYVFIHFILPVVQWFVGKPVTALSSLRTSAPDDKYSDSASEFSDDASSMDGLWQPDWRLCRETDSLSGAESDTRRLARRKLYVACAVSLVFMTGEVIGEMKKAPVS